MNRANQPKYKTCQRINAPGDIHFLTFSCFHSHPLLRSNRSKAWLAKALIDACIKHRFDLHAYVFMPDHVHLLVRPEDLSYEISKFLRAVKRLVTESALKFLSESHAPESAYAQMADRGKEGSIAYRFWQRGGGFDRNINSSDEFFEKLQYIHNNPVKAGLCETEEDWKFSSAGDYARVRIGPVTITMMEE